MYLPTRASLETITDDGEAAVPLAAIGRFTPLQALHSKLEYVRTPPGRLPSPA